MDITEKFNYNIAKINSLQTSFYEKDLIRSAYYNHLNNIPVSKEAILVLKKYGISFSHGNISIDSRRNSIETRKQQYKTSLETKKKAEQHAHSTLDSIYKRNVMQPSEANVKHSQTLIQIFKNAETIFNDSSKLLSQCEEIVEQCFNKNELSYSMICNIIAKSYQSIQNTTKALEEFLQPFLELFDTLAVSSQQEILKKVNIFMEKLQAEKSISADLCIKLSAIRAQNTLKKENDFMDYLQTTITKLDNYIQH